MIEQKKWRRCAQGTAATATIVLLMGGSATAKATTPSTKKLGGGSAVVTTCGVTSGIKVAYTVTAGKITGVTFTGIPTTCFTGLMSMTLSQGTTDVGHAGPTAIAAATLVMTPSILTTNATAPTSVRMSIVGP